MEKRVVLLLTGGTLLMKEGEGGALEPAAYTHNLLSELPVLRRIARVDVEVVCNLDSADMQPSDWITISRAIHRALDRPGVDGVVVVHGTDTMAYTASAAALLLGPVPRPVVFTGAQRPIGEPRTDARGNLVDAFSVATLPVPEVGVAFASRFFRGTRVTKRDAHSMDAFDSPDFPPLVELGLTEHIAHPLLLPGGPLGPFDDRLDPRVLVVRVFPGLDPALLLHALDRGIRGLVLEAYGTGNLPMLGGSLVSVIEEATQRGVPCLIVTQCLRGAVLLERYQGALAAVRAGAISGGDLTVEAAVTKMMIALGRFATFSEVRSYLERNVIGERTPI
ncbi:MAG: asparaginase [Myxococcales bacterium]|nr:asparaginase [Polyangiaceae bacterium]MDW8249970.1 asparaginase [Myxococcales bacterium]